MIEALLSTGYVLARHDYPGDYTLLRVTTEQAADLQPGHALQIAGAAWPVAQASPQQGWVECLQRQISHLVIGDCVQMVGPVGEPFDLTVATPRALLLADDGGVAAILFLAKMLRSGRLRVKPFVLFEWIPPLPFRPQPSRIMTPGLPTGVIGALPLLEDLGIPSRIAAPGEFIPGGFEGTAVELARSWLEALQGTADITIFVSGGDCLREAAQTLADAYRLPCQSRAAVHP